ncbi:MAG: hypothetical protein REH79_00585 [Spiroplasma sp.]|nr:hypothetical protein [Spiroplasma sp.]
MPNTIDANKNLTIVLNNNNWNQYLIWLGKKEKDQQKQEKPLVLNFDNKDFYFYSSEIKETKVEELQNYQTIFLSALNYKQQIKLNEQLEKSCNKNSLFQNTTLLKLKLEEYRVGFAIICNEVKELKKREEQKIVNQKEKFSELIKNKWLHVDYQISKASRNQKIRYSRRIEEYKYYQYLIQNSNFSEDQFFLTLNQKINDIKLWIEELAVLRQTINQTLVHYKRKNDGSALETKGMMFNLDEGEFLQEVKKIPKENQNLDQQIEVLNQDKDLNKNNKLKKFTEQDIREFELALFK